MAAIDLEGEMLGTAETPRDLLRALRAAPRQRSAERPTTARDSNPRPASIYVPVSAHTLAEVLIDHATAHPERIHMRIYEGTSDTPCALLVGAQLR